MAIRMGGTLNIATSSSGDTTLITAANITDYGSRAHLQIMWYDVTSNDVVTITFKDTDGTTVIPAIYATRAAAGGIVVQSQRMRAVCTTWPSARAWLSTCREPWLCRARWATRSKPPITTWWCNDRT